MSCEGGGLRGKEEQKLVKEGGDEKVSRKDGGKRGGKFGYSRGVYGRQEVYQAEKERMVKRGP